MIPSFLADVRLILRWYDRGFSAWEQSVDQAVHRVEKAIEQPGGEFLEVTSTKIQPNEVMHGYQFDTEMCGPVHPLDVGDTLRWCAIIVDGRPRKYVVEILRRQRPTFEKTRK